MGSLRTSPMKKQRELNISAEVEACRAAVRSSGFLQKPQEPHSLTTMTMDPLDPDMGQLTQKCMENERLYWTGTNPSRLQPLFVLPKERLKYMSVQNKTLKDLHNQCLDYLEMMESYGREDISVIYRAEYNS